ncbi:MAG: 16S rRNA (cytidine(1402)-2'-O)-methyltransferase [Ilumatobacter sp.]|uniref:16S rRNA (cytidine(1402)-2'-O)-methyltransferase n=1 Tax=Ilumatobacter sp. TaxID=1967498 RepID=UPI00329A398F
MSTLWLVATPIGNLGDLAPRAVEVLASVALVCCEDTRRTGKLLQHAGIRAERLAVCNEHTEFDRIGEVLDVLASGRGVAVVSDAGTPGISDPGERLVAAAIEAGHVVSAVPGPAAATMAVTISGFVSGRYVYEGFLPRKGRDRAARLADVAAEHRTVVLYEAPHRIERTLADLLDVCGPDRAVAVSRELTKLHEETVRGTLGSLDIGEPRGEYVIVLGPVEPAVDEATDDAVRSLLVEAIGRGASTRDAATSVAEQTGRRRRDVYQLAVDLDV